MSIADTLDDSVPAVVLHAGGGLDLDFAVASRFVVKLSGNVTFVTAHNHAIGMVRQIVFLQDEVGGWTVDWPEAGARYPRGQPAIDTDPSAIGSPAGRTVVNMGVLPSFPAEFSIWDVPLPDWVKYGAEIGALLASGPTLLADAGKADVDLSNVGNPTFKSKGDAAGLATDEALAEKLAIASNLSDLDDADAALLNLGASADSRALFKAANYAAVKVLLAIAAGDVSGLGDLATLDDVTASLISDASADGRSLITAATYAAMRALLDLEAGTDFYSIAAADALLAAKQPLDGDLTAIAALTTTAFGRGLLTVADATALRAAAVLTPGVIGSAVFLAATAAEARTATRGGVETLNSDANSNAAAGGSFLSTVETTTLTANRNRNLTNTAAAAGDIYEYRRTSADAFTRQIRDNGGTNLGAAVPVGITARFMFDGTNWINWGRSAS